MMKVLLYLPLFFPAAYKEFKDSLSVIIPKPKKPDYSSIKAYWPISLVSCLSKLGGKILTNCLQFKAVANLIFHPCQYGCTIKHSTEDVGIHVVNKIRDGWSKGQVTSMMALDLAQFFPSINHNVLTHTLCSQGFNPLLVDFFQNFLSDYYTSYWWNTASSPSIQSASLKGKFLHPP